MLCVDSIGGTRKYSRVQRIRNVSYHRIIERGVLEHDRMLGSWTMSHDQIIGVIKQGLRPNWLHSPPPPLSRALRSHQRHLSNLYTSSVLLSSPNVRVIHLRVSSRDIYTIHTLTGYEPRFKRAVHWLPSSSSGSSKRENCFCRAIKREATRNHFCCLVIKREAILKTRDSSRAITREAIYFVSNLVQYSVFKRERKQSYNSTIKRKKGHKTNTI